MCVTIDNASGNDVSFGSTPGWMVDPGASASPNSARPGPGAVVLESAECDDDTVRLPVRDSSNNTPTVWTTDGSEPRGHGPGGRSDLRVGVLRVQRRLVDDGPDCADVWSAYEGAVETDRPVGRALPTQLGYVQLATVSELASAIAGATAVDTAAEAIEHQYDYTEGDCVGDAVLRRRGPGWCDLPGS